MYFTCMEQTELYQPVTSAFIFLPPVHSLFTPMQNAHTSPCQWTSATKRETAMCSSITRKPVTEMFFLFTYQQSAAVLQQNKCKNT